MSLLRQLWLSVSAAMLAILLGTLVVSVVTARSYLEQQLLSQANDGAASLALSITQQGTDVGTVETLINATFDSGHYHIVRYIQADGTTGVERIATLPPTSLPNWFVQLFPLHAEPGTALVSKGWQQAGQVYIQSHTRFAHEALWKGSLVMASILAGAGLFWAMGVSLLMRRVKRPLDEMAEQARRIGEGQFLTIEPTNIVELKDVGHALNRMSERIKNLFAEQAARIAELQSDASRDSITGLTNRNFFMGELRNALSDESAPAGVLTLLRIRNLQLINRTLGREKTDAFLRSIGEQLEAVFGGSQDTVIARLNGADFAVLVQDGQEKQISELARSWQTRLAGLCATLGTEYETLADIAVTHYQRPEGTGEILSRADAALMQAEVSGQGICVAPSQAMTQNVLGQGAWADILHQAIRAKSFRLEFYPVLTHDLATIHFEGMLRLLVPNDPNPIPAGQFMPAAIRLGVGWECDLITVELALAHIRETSRPVAVNLAAQSLLVPQIEQRLQALLFARPQEAKLLSIEISERGLDEDATSLKQLGVLLASTGSTLGIEHFGRKLSVLPNLYALNVSYLKLDGAVVHGIHDNPGNQRLVKAIVEMASGLSVTVIAEQVHTDTEWQALAALGVTGMTGPAASRHKVA